MIKTIKDFLRPILRPHPGKGKRVHQFTYVAPDGSFDYEEYKRVQTEGNKSKIDDVWATESSIQFLSSYIKQHLTEVSFGICHGTRRGLEQKWFREQLEADVVGTEIADTAKDFPNTVQWDFHEENPEWIGYADFVYSNSFDHSYDPKKAISVWMRSLKPGGICILEHSRAHTPEHSKKLDPFGASLDIMPYLVLEWGGGLYSVREILHDPKEEGEYKRSYIIIRNNVE